MSLIVSNPVDKKKIKDALFEISGSYMRIEAERELIKDIVADLADKYELTKKNINKIARAYHKNNFNQQVSESEEFQELYESLLETE
ncbi:Double-stranded DNA-binding protein [uncultured Caudovirales phage]|uniref:Double-stranded DNA-binding protein n=1 Tax=uncultured Caudovirales phage TaxID=2100421 RepID=A0A6J5L1B4_9CAUD|nr:Double-stranded DNA-binding protein [uncultured Caudovirales phage]